METENILGVDVLVTSYEEFMAEVTEDIQNHRQKTIVAINPEKIMKIREDDVLQGFIQEASYKIPDGVGILMASKKLGGRIKNRITGVDTMDALCALAAEKGFKVFLLGGKEDAVAGAKSALEKKHQNLNIVGYRNGYDLIDEDVVKEINDSGAQILFVAMGSPRQELWIRKHKESLQVNIFQGVGGSLDVFSGSVKRAPLWMQKIGLEWLHRLLMDPRRVFRQVNLLKFYYLVKKTKK